MIESGAEILPRQEPFHRYLVLWSNSQVRPEIILVWKDLLLDRDRLPFGQCRVLLMERTIFLILDGVHVLWVRKCTGMVFLIIPEEITEDLLRLVIFTRNYQEWKKLPVLVTRQSLAS